MNDSSQDEAETAELKCERSVRLSKGADMSEETSISPKEPDTILSVIVLLLACLGLAALAHVFV